MAFSHASDAGLPIPKQGCHPSHGLRPSAAIVLRRRRDQARRLLADGTYPQ